ncbi:hypothetical protein CK203_020772 [Vitis vinifera]|uniref:Uncharacterized protein n=1 Tax=Vitis vinifera TaxID=29760 RepID=A0A438IHT4_VITVI|nr:hypothetical protein CK203_020772 [Vitis vinifera]
MGKLRGSGYGGLLEAFGMGMVMVTVKPARAATGKGRPNSPVIPLTSLPPKIPGSEAPFPDSSALDRRTAMASATSSAEILRHTTAFTSETLSQSKLRLRLLSALRRKLPTSDQNVLRQLNLAAETLENAIPLPAPSIDRPLSASPRSSSTLTLIPSSPRSFYLFSTLFSTAILKPLTLSSIYSPPILHWLDQKLHRWC